tara:strand:- start:1761 stop:1997 length:237 start_codon:yes stop_codon:yes gene_type:complete
MRRIIRVETKPDYVLTLVFDDGTQGQVLIADRLFGPMFEPLKDPLFFAQAKVDKFGAVCWPNNADPAPDALYKTIISH